MDMANAFVAQLAGEPAAKMIQMGLEMRAKDQDDYEFAAVHGLV